MVEGRTHRPVIRSEKCHRCDVCIRGCPAELIPEYRKEEKSLRGTLYRGRDGKTDPEENLSLPPCQKACPIQQDARGYVALIAKEKFREALELIREVNPLPAVCGFICHHPCEEACLREGVDDPVPMRLLKRFVAEYEREGIRRKSREKKKRQKVLVIGSGLFDSPSLELLSETPRHREVMQAVMRQAAPSGNLIHDAHIVTLCIEHGVTELVTGDRDFARFAGNSIVDPFTG